MTHYRLYGLTAASALELPELFPAPHPTEPDLDIRLGTVSPEGLQDGAVVGPFCQVAPHRFWLNVPEVARYQVEDGRTIIIDPLAGVDEASVRVFLLGSCLGALLFQRGLLVLHGNAIRVGDACLVCAGDSGSGKSTLAASFMQRGHAILSDDVIGVDAAGMAVPGFPRIKLWQAAAKQLAIDTRGLHRIRPNLEKFNLPLGDRFCAEPLPVRWVYVLHNRSQPGCEFEPIRGMARFQSLRSHTYRVRYMDTMALEPEHLKLCGRLAGRIYLAHVHRADEGLSPTDLAAMILDDAIAHPPQP